MHEAIDGALEYDFHFITYVLTLLDVTASALRLCHAHQKELEIVTLSIRRRQDPAGRYKPENLNLGHMLPILSCLLKNLPITLRGRFRSEVEVQLGLLH